MTMVNMKVARAFEAVEHVLDAVAVLVKRAILSVLGPVSFAQRDPVGHEGLSPICIRAASTTDLKIADTSAQPMTA